MFATSDNGNVIWISFGGTDTSLKRSPNEFFLLLLHFLLITVDWIELRTVCPRQCGNRIFFLYPSVVAAVNVAAVVAACHCYF